MLAPHAPGTKQHESLGGVAVRRFRYLWPATLETVCYQGGTLINLRKKPFNYAKLPALIFFEWWQTMSWLRTGKFDLLHSHWLLPQGFVGVMAAGPLALPHVCTVHGSDIFGLHGALLEKFKAITVRHVNAVTVNSSATRRAVAELCPETAPLHTIPMGVAVRSSGLREQGQSAAIRARFRRGQGPLLLFVGRLVEEKGLADLLEALCLLRDRHNDMTLLVIGEGQERASFERQSAERGLTGQVFFGGWVEPEQLFDYFAAADIFTAPSRTEAQGLTIIEAMMAGRPVVATRTGGIVDSVAHEVSGLLISERSPNELAAAITRLVNDPELAQRLGRRAHHEARAKFSRETSAAQFSELFTSLIQARKAGSRPGR